MSFREGWIIYLILVVAVVIFTLPALELTLSGPTREEELQDKAEILFEKMLGRDVQMDSISFPNGSRGDTREYEVEIREGDETIEMTGSCTIIPAEDLICSQPIPRD